MTLNLICVHCGAKWYSPPTEVEEVIASHGCHSCGKHPHTDGEVLRKIQTS